MKKKCPDCGVSPGELHEPGCDVESCPDCGGQAIGCGCEGEDFENPRLPWIGEHPGLAECREYGLWCKWVEGEGWARCEKTDPEATEDLNQLLRIGEWSPEKRKFICRRSKK